MSNQYKIGEFSKYMGVTPDFLKHYEQYGLIQPNISESNYRYYNFEKASDVIECIRLRNWGFSLKEIQNITQEASMEEILSYYQKKSEELQKMIHFHQILIEELKRFESWVHSSNNKWTIQYLNESIFLPHSMNKEFIQDPRIYEIMEQWTKYLPVVHSSQRIFDCFDQNKEPYCRWGYSVLKQFADDINLPQSEPCELIPRRKCLVINNSVKDALVNTRVNETIEFVKNILNTHHLIADGEIHRIVFHYSHEDGMLTQHSSLIVPLKE